VGGVVLDFAILLGLVHYRRRYGMAADPTGHATRDGQPLAGLALAGEHHAGADRRGAGIDT
jgi:hypothetical protein